MSLHFLKQITSKIPSILAHTARRNVLATSTLNLQTEKLAYATGALFALRAFGTNAYQPDLRKKLVPNVVDEEPLFVHPDEGEHSGAGESDFPLENPADDEILAMFRAEQVVTETDAAYYELIQTLARCKPPQFRQSFPILIHPLLRQQARNFLNRAESGSHFAALAKCVRVSEDFELYDMILDKAKTVGVELSSDFYGEVLPAFTHARNFEPAANVYNALCNAGGAWSFATYDAAVDYLYAIGDLEKAGKLYREGVARGVLKLWVPSTEGNFHAQKLLKNANGFANEPFDRTKNYGQMVLLDGLSQNSCYLAMRLAIEDVTKQDVQVNTIVVQTSRSQRTPLDYHMRMAKNMAGLVNNVSQFMDPKDGSLVRAPHTKVVAQLPEFVIQRFLRAAGVITEAK